MSLWSSTTKISGLFGSLSMGCDSSDVLPWDAMAGAGSGSSAGWTAGATSWVRANLGSRTMNSA